MRVAQLGIAQTRINLSLDLFIISRIKNNKIYQKHTVHYCAVLHILTDTPYTV